MEGSGPARQRRLLSFQLLISAGVGLVITVLCATPAIVGNTETQNTTSANATATGGTITVGATNDTWTPPTSSPGAQRNQGDPPRQPIPNQPSGCTYVVPPPQIQQELGTGGQTPGQWVFPVNCGGPSITNPAAPFWVTKTQAAAAPVNPAALAQQALSKLPLAAAPIEMAPPATTDQLVNVSAWLWISPAAWQGLSATATAGPVSATATASPVEVVWNMGDGDQITCAGPGTPYNPSSPNASTDCSYTWTQSSDGQPNGAYEVTATVYWQVAWTATGAPGGGNLGQVAGPAARVAVRVAESQAINTASGA